MLRNSALSSKVDWSNQRGNVGQDLQNETNRNVFLKASMKEQTTGQGYNKNKKTRTFWIYCFV